METRHLQSYVSYEKFTINIMTLAHFTEKKRTEEVNRMEEMWQICSDIYILNWYLKSEANVYQEIFWNPWCDATSRGSLRNIWTRRKWSNVLFPNIVQNMFWSPDREGGLAIWALADSVAGKTNVRVGSALDLNTSPASGGLWPTTRQIVHSSQTLFLGFKNTQKHKYKRTNTNTTK